MFFLYEEKIKKMINSDNLRTIQVGDPTAWPVTTGRLLYRLRKKK